MDAQRVGYEERGSWLYRATREGALRVFFFVAVIRGVFVRTQKGVINLSSLSRGRRG
jgi:hypothetical protein